MPQAFEHSTSTSLPLSEKHRAILAASGIDPEVAAERGYRTVNDTRELRALEFANYQCLVPTMLVPLHDVAGTNGRYLARPDAPRTNKDGKVMKYEGQPGKKPVLDVPPRCLDELLNTDVDIHITEGQRKVDALASIGACGIGLSAGVWGWMTGGEPLPELLQLMPKLRGRTVFIEFDSDAIGNSGVLKAEQALLSLFKSHGVNAVVVRLPHAPDGSKQGVDDYLVRHGVDAFWELLRESWEAAQVDPKDARIAELEAEVARLTARERTMAMALENPIFNLSEKFAGWAMDSEIAWQTSQGKEAPFVIRSRPVARRIGVEKQTVNAAEKILATAGIIGRRISREFNDETGKWDTVTFITPPPGGVLLAIAKAEASQVVRLPRKKKDKDACPVHPDEPLRYQGQTTCAKCGRVVKSVDRLLNYEIHISEPDEAEPMLNDDIHSSDTEPTEELSTFSNPPPIRTNRDEIHNSGSGSPPTDQAAVDLADDPVIARAVELFGGTPRKLPPEEPLPAGSDEKPPPSVGADDWRTVQELFGETSVSAVMEKDGGP